MPALNPKTLARVRELELKARRTVEGFVSGRHKSPLQGVSVEFAEHREYTPGDDTRHIDWKLYGKTERIYLKRYEQETNLICHLVVDTSESMKYGSGEITKLDYATELAATLAYLVLHQQDSVGLTLFEQGLRYFVPASGRPSHLKQVMHLLGVCQPANLRSQIGPVLDEVAQRISKRSVVIVISDFFSDVDALVRGLKHLRHARHEVVAMQVLDPAELEFPFRDATLFRGLEGLPEVLTEPRGLRAAYQREFQGFLHRVEGGCRSAGVEYERARTDEPLDRFLTEYLATRKARTA